MSESKIMTAGEAIVYMEKGGGAVTLVGAPCKGKFFFRLRGAPPDSVVIDVYSTDPNSKAPVELEASLYPGFLGELYLEYDPC